MHPRVASLAPSGQFTFWESPGRALNVAPGPGRLPRRLSAPRNDSFSKKCSVGAIMDRPQILPKQNLSPQGEILVFPFGKSEKLRFSAGDQ